MRIEIKFETGETELLILNKDEQAHCATSDKFVRFNDLRQVLKARGHSNWQELKEIKYLEKKIK